MKTTSFLALQTHHHTLTVRGLRWPWMTWRCGMLWWTTTKYGRSLCHISDASLQWHHNGRDVVSNHRRDEGLLNHLFRCRSKKTSKCRVTGLCAGNSPDIGEFPAQKASNAKNVFIWWRHDNVSFLDISTLSCTVSDDKVGVITTLVWLLWMPQHYVLTFMLFCWCRFCFSCIHTNVNILNESYIPTRLFLLSRIFYWLKDNIPCKRLHILVSLSVNKDEQNWIWNKHNSVRCF